MKLIRVNDSERQESDHQVYLTVVEIAVRYGVDPSMSVEAQDFFSKLLEQYTGQIEDMAAWLEQQIPLHFVAINGRPKWIQSPAWPFQNSQPMIFAGQIDIVMQEGARSPDIFHDDASLYVFVGRKIAPIVIMQQF